MNSTASAPRKATPGPTLAAPIARMAPPVAWLLHIQVCLIYLAVNLLVRIVAGWVEIAPDWGWGVSAVVNGGPALAALAVLHVPLPDAAVGPYLRLALRHRHLFAGDLRHITSPHVAAAASCATAATTQDSIHLTKALHSRSALDAYTEALDGRFLTVGEAGALLYHPYADRGSREALPVSVLTYYGATDVLPDTPAAITEALRVMGCVHLSLAQARDALTPLTGDTDGLRLAAHTAARCADLTDPNDLTGPDRAALLTEIAGQVAALPTEGRMLLAALLELDTPPAARGPHPTSGGRNWPDIEDLLTVAAAAGQAAAR